jgi:hypothetical protein
MLEQNGHKQFSELDIRYVSKTENIRILLEVHLCQPKKKYIHTEIFKNKSPL